MSDQNAERQELDAALIVEMQEKLDALIAEAPTRNHTRKQKLYCNPSQPMLYPGVMTLRQHFAGMALTGLAVQTEETEFAATCWTEDGGLKEDTVKATAIAARQLADALIKELAETEAHDGKA